MTQLRLYLDKITNRQMLGILLLSAIFSSIASFFVREENILSWLSSWLQNFGTEMFGAFLTFIFIELVRGGRRIKMTLASEMLSSDHLTALQAVNRLRELGWVDREANKPAYKRARVYWTHLEGIYLRDAKLQEANLASFNLREANLRKANLTNASLRHAILESAIFDSNTVLPDGSHWVDDVDITRFTNPNHPDFWEPDWVKEQQEKVEG